MCLLLDTRRLVFASKEGRAAAANQAGKEGLSLEYGSSPRHWNLGERFEDLPPLRRLFLRPELDRDNPGFALDLHIHCDQEHRQRWNAMCTTLCEPGIGLSFEDKDEDDEMKEVQVTVRDTTMDDAEGLSAASTSNNLPSFSAMTFSTAPSLPFLPPGLPIPPAPHVIPQLPLSPALPLHSQEPQTRSAPQQVLPPLRFFAAPRPSAQATPLLPSTSSPLAPQSRQVLQTRAAPPGGASASAFHVLPSRPLFASPPLAHSVAVPPALSLPVTASTSATVGRVTNPLTPALIPSVAGARTAAVPSERGGTSQEAPKAEARSGPFGGPTKQSKTKRRKENYVNAKAEMGHIRYQVKSDDTVLQKDAGATAHILHRVGKVEWSAGFGINLGGAHWSYAEYSDRPTAVQAARELNVAQAALAEVWTPTGSVKGDLSSHVSVETSLAQEPSLAHLARFETAVGAATQHVPLALMWKPKKQKMKANRVSFRSSALMPVIAQMPSTPDPSTNFLDFTQCHFPSHKMR
ncbi:hypothetical protein JCM11641_006011 [Rhodosporidiobolus odoratus]